MDSDATRAMEAYASMFDALLEGVQIIGFDYRYLVVNAASARHGRSTAARMIGRTVMQCYPGVEETPVFATLRSCLEQRTAHVIEHHFRFEDGVGAHFELRIEPVPQGACVLSLDISRRKEAEANLRAHEARLQQAEQLEALGQLATGIAREYNNLLGALLGYGEAALARPEGPQPADIHGMMAVAQNSAELTKQLLAYGHRLQLHTEVLDPVALRRNEAARSLAAPTQQPASVGPAPVENKVLVADDDALLRTLAEHTLQTAGYRVLTARSGDQALAVLKADATIAVLVTDVVMPGLRGPELIAQARALRPSLKVLCTSGYALSALKDHSAELANVAFLDKPYLPSALVRAVKALFGP